MMTKVFDFFKSILWYIVNFIYDLIDNLLMIIKKLNSIDIIDSLSNNQVFKNLYTGVIAIAITLFALFIIWKFVMKILDPDDEITIKMIVMDSVKCGLLILLSTFLFVQVSSFSIKLANYTGNLFETSTNVTMADNMLTMFIDYNPDYESSDKFEESKTISELVSSGSFNSDEKYLDKYVTKNKIIFSDDKDYKYEINWIMAILIGGFFLYALFFAGIMLGRRQIEFLFLFAIAPVVFATSVCNKQRRGAVIEQLVSLALQSAVIMLIVNLTAMVMQEINATTFFTNDFHDIIMKALLYLGCATFILTGSQVVNRFIGSNVSANSGREHLMALSGYGRLARTGAIVGGAAALGGGLLAGGLGMKGANFAKNTALTQGGLAIGSMGAVDSSSGATQSRMQKMASALGTKMYVAGQQGFNNSKSRSKGFSASDMMMNMGSSTISNAVRTVAPRASYNASYYRRRNNIM
ncbi:MAG: hypothetical protein IJE04_00705 [Bacilli bacterium]|nr:hypothetical protein [Bacilli bacterium]